MAKTNFSRTNALTVEWWSAVTFQYGLFKNYFSKFVGKKMARQKGKMITTSPNAMIQTKQDFKTHKKGDKITFALIDPLSGEGVIDDERLEDNEEALTSHDWNMILRRRRHATRSEGQLSDRRPAFDVQVKSRGALGMWLARIHDADIIAAGSGVANSVGTISALAPSSTRVWYGGQKTDDTLEEVANDAAIDSETNNLFGPEVIEVVKRQVTMTEPIMRPIIIGGQEYYLIFIHPLQAKALKQSTKWKAAHQYAGVRGPKSAFFTGALGEWDGVIIHELPKIETRLGAGGSTASEYFELADDCASGITVARALFCGAQAVCAGYGGRPRWTEDKFDYDNEWGIALSLFLAIGKTQFNSIDFGVCVVDTAIVAD